MSTKRPLLAPIPVADVSPELQLDHDYVHNDLIAWAAAVIDHGVALGALAWSIERFNWHEQVTINWRWLYVARNRESGIVKIGLSRSPISRIAGLGYDSRRTSGVYDPVAVLPYCDDGHENKLCGLLNSYRMAGREWFSDCIQTRMFCWHLVRSRGPRVSVAVFPIARAYSR